MFDLRFLALTSSACAALFIIGCASPPSESPPSESVMMADDGGRALLGAGAPYIATVVDATAVNSDMAARRAVAWEAIRKVTAPYSVPLDNGHSITVPSFLTWYEEDEIRTMMREMSASFEIADGAPGFHDDQIDEYLELRIRELRDNSGDFSDVEPDVIAHAGAHRHRGMGGNLFSPAFARHVLRHISEIGACSIDSNVDYIAEKEQGIRASFSPCMSREFPRDAIMFKPGWREVGADDKVGTRAFPTGPETMRLLLAELQQGETRVREMPSYDPADPEDPTNPETPKDPDALHAQNFYVAVDRSGQKFALQSLHVVTKEIDEWVWATLWWSPIPNGDFGQDRPSDLINGLENYKMCVATTFMEHDGATPSHRFPQQPELAEVLESTIDPQGEMVTDAGVASWCANPYVEGGFHQKTCIGCHQPAGGAIGGGNIRNVKSHPGDFAFTFPRFQLLAADLRNNP